MLFRDRRDAGRRLAVELAGYRDQDPLVLGLPRGGVPVAYEVARALGARLDVWVVRKVGAPYQPELGIGAVAEGGELVLNRRTMAILGIPMEQARQLAEDQMAEVERRVRHFRGDHPAPAIDGRTVLLVDDGIATGGTMQAAIRAVRGRGPKRLVLAVPVAASDTLERLRPEVDDVVCIESTPYLSAIGLWYRNFGQTTDEEVIELLQRAHEAAPEAAEPAPEPADPPPRGWRSNVEVGPVRLQGELTIPDGAQGIVLFAHGSGSSRHSPRNRFVAAQLQRQGLATLLFDLLTPDEEDEDALTGRLRFDIDMLSDRLVGATDWVVGQAETSHLHIGYFGASTGAAAALAAAAERPDVVKAVVSRGGRPDLAGAALPRVQAPTLLIVGDADSQVLRLNQAASRRIHCPKEVAIVPGATHLFEEPGALERVAEHAAAWFTRYLHAERLAAAG